jgi:hypothetical protein
MGQPGAECPDYLKRLLKAAAPGAVPRGSVRVVRSGGRAPVSPRSSRHPISEAGIS